VEFDEAVGLGRIASASGEYAFHSTQIADGSRTIAVGTEVTFEVIPGRLGRWEAGGVAAVAT
jgi:cold shock CspA family protein